MATYLIVDIDVKDASRYQEYIREVPSLVEKHHGEYLVRGGVHEVLEGAWQPRRLVLFRFPDRAAVQDFFDDPEYAPLKALRHAVAESNIVVVEGIELQNHGTRQVWR